MKKPLSNNDEHNELPKEAAVLRSVVKDKNTFIVPAAYFEEFPDKIQTLLLMKKGEDFKVNEQYFEELPHKIKVLTLQEKLADSPAAPEGYFEKLPRLLQDKVNESHKKENKTPVYSWAGFALAASLVIGWFIFKPFEEKINHDLQSQSIAQLSKQEISVAVEQEVFDENMLVEAVAEMENTNTTIQAEEEQNGKNAEQEAIANYLMEQNIDLNTLVNEL